nr:PREDICTED: adhesion G protein-coupled receptor B3-like [Latimeria chalumnae]|eukprot:XP_014339570.1 PREDICTED: adhesion G protein-coupled receptor B3-like [Latimeria chalumnae]
MNLGSRSLQQQLFACILLSSLQPAAPTSVSALQRIKTAEDAVTASDKAGAASKNNNSSSSSNAMQEEITWPSRLIFYINRDSETPHHVLDTRVKNQQKQDQAVHLAQASFQVEAFGSKFILDLSLNKFNQSVKQKKRLLVIYHFERKTQSETRLTIDCLLHLRRQSYCFLYYKEESNKKMRPNGDVDPEMHQAKSHSLSAGIPLIFCATTVPAAFQGYGTEQNCWLSIKLGTIWTFVAPALAIIFINLLILIKVTREIVKKSIHRLRNNQSWHNIKTNFRVVAVLTPVLGITWIFGILAVNESVIIFQYLFCIANSLQGLFIFILHCVINKDMNRKIQEYRLRLLRQSVNAEIRDSIHSNRRRNVTVVPYNGIEASNQGSLTDSGHSSPSRSEAWSDESSPQEQHPSSKSRKNRARKIQTENQTFEEEYQVTNL